MRAILAVISLAQLLAGCAGSVSSDSIAAREFATQKIGTCCWIDDRLWSEPGATGSTADEAKKKAAADALAEQDAALRAAEASRELHNAEMARQLAAAKESEKNQAARIAKALADESSAELEGVFFDFDKSTLKEESKKALRAVREVLTNDPNLRLEIQGHTDIVGSAEYNQKLSKRRAEAVKEYIVRHLGIASDRLSAVGYGATMPGGDNNTEVGRAYNRRVVLLKK